MLYVCVGDVMYVVFELRGAVGARVWEVWVFPHADVECGLCAYCCSPQCWTLHDLQFVSAGRGCKRRPYGGGIL